MPVGLMQRQEFLEARPATKNPGDPPVLVAEVLLLRDMAKDSSKIAPNVDLWLVVFGC